METNNVAEQIAEIEELNTTLNVLDRVRGIIGEEEYAERVKVVVSMLPTSTKLQTGS